MQSPNPANVSFEDPLWRGWQARTPAVPEERVLSSKASLKGIFTDLLNHPVIEVAQGCEVLFTQLYSARAHLKLDRL